MWECAAVRDPRSEVEEMCDVNWTIVAAGGLGCRSGARDCKPSHGLSARRADSSTLLRSL